MRLIGLAVVLAGGPILSPYAALFRHLEIRRLLVRCHALATIAWLLTVILTAPLAAEAQSRIPSIGILMPGPVAPRLHMIEALRQGLREQGYVEGQNITLVVRSADGVMERLPALAPSSPPQNRSVTGGDFGRPLSLCPGLCPAGQERCTSPDRPAPREAQPRRHGLAAATS